MVPKTAGIPTRLDDPQRGTTFQNSKLASTSGFQSVFDYFESWIIDGTSKASAGWKQDYVRNYEKYVHPIIGTKNLFDVRPSDVAKVLVNTERLGRAPQTRLHVYNLMHKMFRDAVEMYEILGKNPVKRELKPVVPKKEAMYLPMEEALKLLDHVRDKPYEVAIWLNLYVGMRIGEIQALRCKDVDLANGKILIRSTYVRKEKRLQDHPKGKEWHSVKMPPELGSLVSQVVIARDPMGFVAASNEGQMLDYNSYLKALKRYCSECGIREVASHGLRHSTSEIYLAHGATRDDIFHLFKHSSLAVTERYMHDKGEKVQKIAEVIRLFSGSDQCSTGKPSFS